jgi:hypothetical protein
MKRYSTNLVQLPAQEATSVPWEQVHMDLICTLNIKIKGHKKPVQFIALMCIDPVLNLLEVGTVKDKMSKQVTKTFKHLWLSRYPQPRTCVHDRGPEFIAHEFQTALEDTGIGLWPTSARNPQSNGIIEQVHHAIAAVIRIVVNSLSPINTVEKANDIVQDALHKAMHHAMRCASHNSLDNISPGALTFRRDMYLNIPLIANVLILADLRQKQIDKHLMRANAKRKTHDYQVGDQVLIKRALDASSKLEPTYKGPYPIVQVHINGTVTVLLQPNTTER